MQTINKPVNALKKGDLVAYHGGIFKITSDARPGYSDKGPDDVAIAQSVCLSGEVPGYFRPGSEWSFQGNTLSCFCVITP